MMDKTEATIGDITAANSSTWADRLLLNLISYSLIIVPITLTVLATRYRLCPTPLQNSVLVQWFVYGYNQASVKRNVKSSSPNESIGSSSNEGQQRKRLQLSSHLDGPNQSDTILKFIWCFLGLEISYLIWGVLQEKIMTSRYEYSGTWLILNKSKAMHLNNEAPTFTFHDSQFLVFINRIIAFILSIIALFYNRPRKQSTQSLYVPLEDHNSKPPSPLYEYIYCSLSNILSSWCQYEALKYVNFPTQVLSKSCKIIPVMLMSKLLLNKKYQSFDYLCAILLSVGMFIFLLNQPVNVKVKDSDVELNQTSAHHLGNQAPLSIKFKEIGHNIRNSTLVSGLVILALYLTFDSFTSNWQQSLFTRYQISNWQMMAVTNFYSIILTLTSLYQLGTLEPAFKLLSSSSSLCIDCLFMSIMSSVGQLFVYYTIKRFGSVIFTVIMTLRQFLAILLSCAIYGHELTLGSTAGLMVVFLVIAYQMWSKYRTTRNKSYELIENRSQIQFKSLSN